MHQARIQLRQPLRTGKEHVRGILALARGPVIGESHGTADGLVSRMVLQNQFLQFRRPPCIQLLIQQLLGFGRVFNPGKTIIHLLETHPQSRHLLGQPVAAIQADVDQKRKPRLQTQVHEAEDRMQMVKIIMQAFAPAQLRLQHFSLGIAAHGVSPARLHAAQNPDEAGGHAVLLRDHPRHLLLAHLAGRQINQRTPGFFGQLLRRRLDLSGDLQHQSLEILHQETGPLDVHLHHRRMIKGAEGARQTQSVEAAQDADDIGLMFLDKRVGCAVGIYGSFV